MEKRTRSHKRTEPGTHEIFFRASTENVKSLLPASLSSFIYELACSNCGKVLKNVHVDPEPHEEEGYSKKLNYCAPCPECKKTLIFNYVDVMIDKGFDQYLNWNKIFLVDLRCCRIDVVKCEEWKIVSRGGVEYEWDGKDNFFEYDEGIESPVGVSDVDFHVVELIV